MTRKVNLPKVEDGGDNGDLAALEYDLPEKYEQKCDASIGR